ncbi:MAG: hypothetical protein NT027_00980 [Proteobacteria bacterium]|nr:hypothetical protein [Pseudomonadota bacterium]
MKNFISMMFVLIFSNSGQSADLSQYSSEELMSEVGRRIDLTNGSGGTQAKGYLIDFRCNGAYLTTNLVSEQGVELNRPDQVSASNGSECGRISNILGQRFSGMQRGLKILKLCNGAYVNTYRVDGLSGAKPFGEQVSVGSSAECLRQVYGL